MKIVYALFFLEFVSLYATMWTGFGQMGPAVTDVTKGTIVGSGQLVGGQLTTVNPHCMTPYERNWGWNERKGLGVVGSNAPCVCC